MTTLESHSRPIVPMLRVRLSFMMFLQYAIWGAWLPILYPFLLGHRGFTLGETGLCLAAGAVGAIFGPFIAGQLADRTIATEKLLAISHFIGALLVFMLATAESFPTFVLLSALYGFVYAPTLSLTNSLAFAHITDRDRDFGPVRLWGTIGWIVAGILVGQALLRLHSPEGVSAEELRAAQDAGRVIAFHLSAILGIAMGLYCLTLPYTPPTAASATREPMAWKGALAEIRLQPLVTLFMIAIPVSVIHQFYFVYTSDFVSGIQANAQSGGADAFARAVNQIFGVGGGGLMTIGQMTEIAVLAMMPIIAKVLSRKSLLAVGLCAYAARMALFAYFPELGPVLLGVAMHGLCFGCFIFVAFMVVDEQTTPDVRATAQSLMGLVIFGIGIIVGSWFSTAVIGNWATVDGAMNFTRLFSVPMWMALACLVALLVFYPKRVVKVEP